MKICVYTSGRKAKKNDLPSMTEEIPQLSIEDIFRDYCRGVLHPSTMVGMYDPDGTSDDDFDHLEEVEDISQLVSSAPAPTERGPEPAPAPAKPGPEPKKNLPNEEPSGDEL